MTDERELLGVTALGRRSRLCQGSHRRV